MFPTLATSALPRDCNETLTRPKCFGSVHYHSSVSSRPSVSSAITINQNIIKPSSVIRDLGVLFDAEPSMRQHVSLFHLRRIRSVRRQLGRDVTAKLVTALMLSRLDHCNTVLAGLPAMTLAPLQTLLCIRRLKAPRPEPCPRPCHSCFAGVALVDDHRENTVAYKLCLLVHNMFVGHAPDYIASLLTPASDILSRSSLRSSSNCDLVVRRTSRNISDRAFSVASPRAWNRMPSDLKLLRSITSFKKKLKSFLLYAAYTEKID